MAKRHLRNGLFSRIAGTRKVKPIWILTKEEMTRGHGISWTICNSFAPSLQTYNHARTSSINFLQAGYSS